jgi:hypothetical protein
VSAKAPTVARWSWLLVLVALAALYLWYARGHDLEADIRRDLAASGGKLVDLPKSVPFVWNRVCVAGPYSDSKTTSALLGFDWNSEAHSDVRSNEGVVLLVFASGDMVVGAVDFSRELLPWAGKCYLREAARFQIL